MHSDFIVLLNPTGRVLLGTDGMPTERKHCTPPLGLAYLASNLRMGGFGVSVIDSLAEGYDNERKVDNFIFYGLDDKEIINRINKISPKIVGISILFSNLASEALRLARIIKKNNSNIKIVLGGHHPSSMPERIMRDHEYIDYILVGEADNTLVKLCESTQLKNSDLFHIKGLFWRDNHGSIINNDKKLSSEYKGIDFQYFSKKNSPNPNLLDSLPLPAWDLFPMESYWSTNVRLGASDTFKTKYSVMVSTRGCPHICDFCTSPLMGGFKNYRKRTNQDVIDEILFMKEKYGIEEIQFLDDNFFVSRLRVKELLKLIADQCKGMLFSVPAGTEANTLDEEIISLLSKAGFYKITLAIESGNAEIQSARIDKNVDLAKVPITISLLRKYGLEIRAFFMIGFPGESKESILNTANYALSLDLDDFAISVVTPLPGTPLFDEALNKNLLSSDFDPNDIRYSVSSIKIEGMTSEEIENVRILTWKKHQDKIRKNKKNIKFKSHFEFSSAGFTSLDVNSPKTETI